MSGKIKFEITECSTLDLARKILTTINYFIIKKDDKNPDDIIVLGSNLKEKEIENFINKYMGKSKYDSYGKIVTEAEGAGGGSFVALGGSESERGIFLCCGVNARTMHHEKGHAKQCEDYGYDAYERIREAKVLHSSYLEIHNIIVNENAKDVIILEPPEKIKEDYRVVEKSNGKVVYIRVKYMGFPAEVPKEDTIKSYRTLLHKRASENTWFSEIACNIKRIHEDQKIGTQVVRDGIERMLLYFCKEMIKERSIFEGMPKNLS